MKNTSLLVSTIFDEIALLMLENQNIGMFEIFNATNISSEVLNFVEKLSDVTI